MSGLAVQYATSRQVFTSGIKRNNSFAFRWRSLVAPWWGYAPNGMTWERVLVTLEYLAIKASDYECPHPDGWGRSTPFDKLNATSGHGCSSFSPLGSEWRDDLFKRFRHLLLGYPCSEAQASYANDLGFSDIDNICTIRQRTYKPGHQPITDAQVQSLITSLHQVTGKTRDKHNQYHPKAIHVQRSGIGLGRDVTSVFLQYGYWRDSSTWGFTVAKRGKKELMLDFLIRASFEMERLVDGYTSPVPAEFDKRDVEEPKR